MYDLPSLLLVLFFAFLYEISDAALGQGYGTLGSPTFILLGFDPKMIVPSILISQALGGLSAAFFHNRFRNADFTNHNTEDMKKVYLIVGCGIAGVLGASFIGFKISKEIMTAYIGLVVLAMGLLILSGVTLGFTWRRLSVIGGISAFNKGLSGGGYGPVVTGGQALIGVGGKAAIAVTDFAEAPICIAGFIGWCLLQGLPQWDLTLTMTIGAVIAPPIGAWITYRIPTGKLRPVLGSIIVILGVLCLMKVLNP